MAANALPAGHAVQEYRIEKLLGVGGFGLTYLAIDQNLGLKVALKEYLPGEFALRGPDQSIVPRSEESAETFDWGKRRFLDESRTVASFRHPNIVRVMRFFEASGSAYMVMEFVEGASLPEWILRRRPLPESQLAGLLRPLLEGLEVVHRAGYMHRDIKPANIYMRDDDSPVLIDFGSARQKSAELTAVVSPGYAPFEQYHTQGKQGPWSDLYALGGVLYWIITGNPPHEAAARIRKDTMPPAVQAGDRKAYRSEFLAAIDWALMPNEDERPQSVQQWRDALLGPAAAPTPRTERLQQAPAMPATDPALLKSLETELAQHLGPITTMVVKNAAKKAGSQAELVQLLASELPDAARAAFEKRFSGGSQPVSRPNTVEPATVLAASRFPAAVLERAEQRLAEYIGAVARIVVKRAAVKARDEAELYLLIADEIDDKAEKKAFIRQAVSISGKP
ncbi:MAG: serine/threonine protein kinase [Betaproteobacteria bacterium]|nr:serine/threonine protein kinase [Betaproteobacteria bacterium]